MKMPRWLLRGLLGKRLPITSGVINVPYLTNPITIIRDHNGIPHIKAQDDRDAWYGIGFCQGQDRAFQLEVMLRIARGSLSELLGPAGIKIDRFSRQIGFARNAEDQINALDPEMHANTTSFAKGISDGVQLGIPRVPHEFAILRARPTPYTITDVIASAKLQAFVLASNWDIEIARYQILVEDGPDAVKALDPAYAEWHPVSKPAGSPQGPIMDRLVDDISALREAVGYVGGSNNWALAPEKTSTGRPLLSNDPHLRPTLPAHWYLAHITTPKWSVAGATFVGGPGFPAGHNGTAGWGVTAGMVDTTDLFIEQLSPDGTSVRQDDNFIPCEIKDEVIRIRGRRDLVERVLITPRGPIIGTSSHKNAGITAFSLKATWLDSMPIKGIATIHKARSFSEFQSLCDDWPLSSLNMVYADTSGSIGWQLVGTVPVRKSGWGTIPKPGWEKDADWEHSHVPHDQMPYLNNSPSGIVATANNSPTKEGDGPYLGIDWLDGYRISRIFETLGEHDDWDIQNTMTFLQDVKSMPWEEIREILLTTPVDQQYAREALDLLATWDGQIGVDSAPATVFELFMAEITRTIAKTKAPNSADWSMGKSSNIAKPYTILVARRTGHTIRLLKEQPTGWFDEGWNTVIQKALVETIRILRIRYGNDHKNWAWGDVRKLILRHPFGERKMFSHIFNRGPFPLGGDANTISQAAAPLDNPTGNPLSIPSMRMVIDIGKWENSRFSIPGGQSGNPMSPHYDDLLPLWIRGEGVAIPWNRESVLQEMKSNLKLLPA